MRLAVRLYTLVFVALPYQRALNRCENGPSFHATTYPACHSASLANMPVREFFHDRQSSENGINNQRPNHNARKLAAEMARVTVPPTRLPDMNRRSSAKQYQPAPLSPPAVPQDDQGDMFDTDLEGIDDTTTITGSMIDDGVAIVNPRPRRFQDYDPPVPQQQEDFRESFTERMAREFVQEGSSTEQHNEPAHQEEPMAGNEHDEFDDPELGRVLSWEDTMELDKQPRTWQQIEAALRQGSQQSNQRNDDFRDSYLLQDSPRRRPPIPEQRANLRSSIRPATSYPAPKPLSRPRIANSRFSTPNTPFSPASANANATEPRETLRPASVAGRPQSPPENAIAKMELVPRDPLQDQQHQHHRVPSGREDGIFDTTNLSAVDSSESSDPQTVYTSVHLSTLSPSVSSKRDSGEAFESDYPPNILRSKTFAELEAESFDYNPTPLQPVFPPQRTPLSLNEKLERLKSLTDGQRRTFFSSLTLAEWEDSGDWLIEQFQELLKKTKDARTERRKMAHVFEKEIARRYAAVEAESQGLKSRLNEMKTGGLGVLKAQRQI